MRRLPPIILLLGLAASLFSQSPHGDGFKANCADCHTVAGNFAAFICIDGHEHDDPFDLADRHDGVPRYVYQSNACYACHPDGEKD